MYKLAVFDLDGTLLDTLEDLAIAVRYALKKCGLPSRTNEEVRDFVGNGIVSLIQRAVGDNMEKFDEALAAFKGYYREHSIDKTKPYEGITDTVQEIKNRGVKIAVLSNKVHNVTVELADVFFKDLFDVVAGEKEAMGIRKKPAPDALFAIMADCGVSARETVYIGDSEVDIQTAKNAGVDCISVCWGFREKSVLKENGGSMFAINPSELLRFFI